MFLQTSWPEALLLPVFVEVVKSFLTCGQLFAYWQDDGSGRQEWTFALVTGGYTITTQQGRAGCGIFLTTVACAAGNGVTFANNNDGSGLQVCTAVT
jgi:hypothetical protein